MATGRPLALAAFALAVAAATAALADDPPGQGHPLPPDQQQTFADVGRLLGMRAYSTGIMEYCFDTVEARPAFTAASESWKTRNLDDLNVLDGAFVRLGVSPADRAKLDRLVADQIKADVAKAASAIAFCEKAAEMLNSGGNDIKTRAADSVARLKAAGK